ncbi:MAG TPA: hypothetical protein VNX65_03655 [Patescibacteria group bacterium]|jgi:hypothetical protein|nr:hypothetical protein [Patescibacteria group bacterium]
MSSPDNTGGTEGHAENLGGMAIDRSLPGLSPEQPQPTEAGYKLPLSEYGFVKHLHTFTPYELRLYETELEGIRMDTIRHASEQKSRAYAILNDFIRAKLGVTSDVRVVMPTLEETIRTIQAVDVSMFYDEKHRGVTHSSTMLPMERWDALVSIQAQINHTGFNRLVIDAQEYDRVSSDGDSKTLASVLTRELGVETYHAQYGSSR